MTALDSPSGPSCGPLVQGPGGGPKERSGADWKDDDTIPGFYDPDTHMKNQSRKGSGASLPLPGSDLEEGLSLWASVSSPVTQEG